MKKKKTTNQFTTYSLIIILNILSLTLIQTNSSTNRFNRIVVTLNVTEKWFVKDQETVGSGTLLPWIDWVAVFFFTLGERRGKGGRRKRKRKKKQK